MIKLQIIFALMLVVTLGYSQIDFASISNTSPCPGEPVVLYIPDQEPNGGCNIVVTALANIKLDGIANSPYLSAHHNTQYNKYDYITVTMPSGHPNFTATVEYGCGVGTVERLVEMKTPLSTNPIITGLDNLIYPDDTNTANASVTSAPSGTTYAWTLNVVSTSSGSISSNAIASPSAASTAINWPHTFVGVVDITATATVCGSSTSTTKRVTVNYLPDFTWSPNSTPAINCSNTTVGYHLQIFNGFTIFSVVPHLNGTGNSIVSSETVQSQSAGWSVQWAGDGNIWVDFTVQNLAGRKWNYTASNIFFDVAEFNPEQIHPIPLANYCGPMTVSLTLDATPGGSSYTYQFCNTGNCGVASPDWTNNTPPTSASFTGISTDTQFRISLDETRCGTYRSDPVTIAVKPTPVVITSDKFIFSGGTFDIPAANMAFSTVAVTKTTAGVTGASDVSILQGNITSGVLATQTLTTSASADGTVTYAITPSNNGCTGLTKYATVAVYKKPAIYSSSPYVYKDVSATLSTDVYDTYQWQTGTGANLATTSTYQTSSQGDYRVAVTRNGAQEISDIFILGGQFTGVNENYIITRSPLEEFSTIDGLEDKTEQEIAEGIQYFDGIGRPLQALSTRMSPTHHDIVQPSTYDQFGREAIKYLPYVSASDNGRIQSNAIATAQPEFYQNENLMIATDPFPFSESVFEASPLNRVVEQGAPGSSWQPNTDHTIRKEYLTNAGTDVFLLNYNSSTGELTLLDGEDAYYKPQTLICNKIIDEEQNDVLEYVDKLGRTVCKKVKAADNKYASTYYIYDDLGNLVVVIPPEGVERIINGN
jgi:hypothetical protein